MDQPCPLDSSMTVSDPVTPFQAPQASPAERRRLQDGTLTRWLWAVGANAPLVGLPVLVLHAISRRTIAPTVWSSLLALPPFLGQVVVLLAAALDVLQRLTDPLQLSQELGMAARAQLPAFAWLTLASVALGTLGHKIGQDRDRDQTRRRLGCSRG